MAYCDELGVARGDRTAHAGCHSRVAMARADCRSAWSTAAAVALSCGDMTCFPTAGHAASWTGLCPGTNESAGKQLSGRTRQANRTLRAALVESARAAVCKRDCYLAAQYRRLVKPAGVRSRNVPIGRLHHIARIDENVEIPRGRRRRTA